MAPSPDVSMLWESVEPTDRLKTRFGFPTSAAAADWVAGGLGDHWGLKISRCSRLVMSDWNVLAWITADDRRLIAKWSVLSPAFSRLADVAEVVATLDESGVPVAAPIRTLDGRLLAELTLGNGAAHGGGTALMGVMPEVEGALLDVTDPRQVTDAGQMLARLHDALAAYRQPFDGRSPRAGEQLVHKDFRSANVLHDGTRIAAVLDFESLTYDSRIADLAHSAVLLATRYRDWAPTTDDVRLAFIDAYETETPLTATERRELDAHVAALLAESWWT